MATGFPGMDLGLGERPLPFSCCDLLESHSVFQAPPLVECKEAKLVKCWGFLMLDSGENGPTRRVLKELGGKIRQVFSSGQVTFRIPK